MNFFPEKNISKVCGKVESFFTEYGNQNPSILKLERELKELQESENNIDSLSAFIISIIEKLIENEKIVGQAGEEASSWAIRFLESHFPDKSFIDDYIVTNHETKTIVGLMPLVVELLRYIKEANSDSSHERQEVDDDVTKINRSAETDSFFDISMDESENDSENKSVNIGKELYSCFMKHDGLDFSQFSFLDQDNKEVIIDELIVFIDKAIIHNNAKKQELLKNQEDAIEEEKLLIDKEDELLDESVIAEETLTNYDPKKFPINLINEEMRESYMQLGFEDEGEVYLDLEPLIQPNIGDLTSHEHQKINKSLEKFEEFLSEDRARLNDAKNKFNYWKSYTLQLADALEDELIYELGEILDNDKYDAYASNKLLSISIEVNPKKAHEQLESASVALEKVLTEDFKVHNLFNIPRGMFRSKAELDFYLSPKDALSDDALVFVKNTFTSIILTYKIIINARRSLSSLLTKALKSAPSFYMTLHDLTPKVHEAKATGKSIHAIQQLLEFEKGWLEENFKKTNQLADIADSLQKNYTRFLNKSVFRITADLVSAKQNYQNEVVKYAAKDQEYLNNWLGIFDDLIGVCYTFLNEKLHIVSINTQKGDIYNHHIHNPFSEAEADENLNNDEIKDILAPGFRLMSLQNSPDMEGELYNINHEEMLEEHQELVLKQADVIVVKN
jgi:hypothetical protein